jgi:hypothetical protein
MSPDASTGGIPASCKNGDEGGPVPTNVADLNAWLNTGAYTCWAHESMQHASTGPHAGEVKVFLNSKLDASLKGSGEHAMGSVAVKEFFAVGGKEVTGWAVSVKTQASSAAGQGYYWYETFGKAATSGHSDGQGEAICVNCHSAGNDFVLIPYPLR